MGMNTMAYNRCVCRKCGSHYATIVSLDEEIHKESCPGCGEKKLKLSGPLSEAEINSLFSSGGG